MLETPAISGSTRFIPLIGHPVQQVKTPGPINRWFVENGIDAVILPIDIKGDGVPAFLEAVRQMPNCIGCSVTMPHKQIAYLRCDSLTESARLTGAVNIIRRTKSGKLQGHMVDGDAMVAALKGNGVAIAGRSTVLVGAGGAGAAIAFSLAEAGVSALTIVDISSERSGRLVNSLAGKYPQIHLKCSVTSEDQFDIAINASPAGMEASDPLPLSLNYVKKTGMVADAITKPATTKWLYMASEQGIRIQMGAEMALAQLPLQLEFWDLSNQSIA